jgi:hypothetical protein
VGQSLAFGQALETEEIGDLGPSAEVDDPGARRAKAAGSQQAEALPGHELKIGRPMRQRDAMDLMDDEWGRLR